MNKFKEIIPYIVILIVVILIRSFIVTPVRVNGPSMDKTLKDKEIMILNKLASIKRGDIVVVDIGSEKVIKRIIGLPGDSIYCQEGKLYINDKLYKENYTSSDTNDFTKEYLNDDEYFVMGDNREYSSDSRKYGGFKKEQIVAIGFMPLFNSNNIGGE